MDTNKLQTSITSHNQPDFFKSIYHHQLESQTQLIDVDLFKETTILAIDCCGWHYKKIFPQKKFVALETIKTVKKFGLDNTYFDRLIDNQSDSRIGWPSIVLENCAVILDRSPFLKYKTLDQITHIFNSIADTYRPDTFFVKMLLTFIDDVRLVDRFYNISHLRVENYIINRFDYNIERDQLVIKFTKKIPVL